MMYGTNIVLYIFPVPSFKIYFINSVMSSDSHKKYRTKFVLIVKHIFTCKPVYLENIGDIILKEANVYLVYKYR